MSTQTNTFLSGSSTSCTLSAYSSSDTSQQWIITKVTNGYNIQQSSSKNFLDSNGTNTTISPTTTNASQVWTSLFLTSNTDINSTLPTLTSSSSIQYNNTSYTTYSIKNINSNTYLTNTSDTKLSYNTTEQFNWIFIPLTGSKNTF